VNLGFCWGSQVNLGSRNLWGVATTENFMKCLRNPAARWPGNVHSR
jgi:hypothetical protein